MNGLTDIKDKYYPVGGCRRYNTLECLSDVKYRGRVENAYWAYVCPHSDEECRLDGTGGECECNQDVGWHSYMGIYKNGTKYYGTVRLGRTSARALEGTFKCYFEDDSNTPVSVVLKYL